MLDPSTSNHIHSEITRLVWLIPANLKLGDLLNRYPPSFSAKLDYFYHIMDHIATVMDRITHEDDEDEGFWVTINAKKLQKFNHNYKKYLNYLLEHKIIYVKKQYIVGKQSRRFSIARRYLSGVEEIPIKDFVIRSKIKELRLTSTSTTQLKSNEYPFLGKWFNGKLKIDVKAAQEEVDNLFPVQKINIGGIKGTLKLQRGGKKYRALISILKLDQQQYYCYMDNTIGRLHTNLTNTRKELRKYLTYNDQRLVALDIKASQPFFSLLLLQESFYDPESLVNIFMFPSLYELINNIQSYNNNIRSVILFIMLVTSSESPSRQGFSAYRKLILKGTFYDQLPALLHLPANISNKELKKEVFTILYSKNRFIHQPQAKVKQAFKRVFPEVYQVFSLLKKSNYRILSHILQRIESYLILEGVCYKISLQYPDVPIFTIHDSVVCPVGNEENIEKLMKHVIHDETGLMCTIKRDYWTKD